MEGWSGSSRAGTSFANCLDTEQDLEMAGNSTLTIIKPDAFGTGKAGKIIAHLEQQGFKVLAARVMHLSQAQAGEFYAVHKERPFYNSLVSFMTSGPCMPMVLEKADAVAALRTAIGATDPAQAVAGTEILAAR